MEVSVETTEGLQRTMTVTVPTERVEKEISSRLNRLKQTVKLNGFRPGKVPMTVIKKRFADSVRYEVAEELINSSFGEAVNQENLSPAGVPKIEPGDFSKGGDITYKAIFEVYPEVKVVDFGGGPVIDGDGKTVGGHIEDEVLAHYGKANKADICLTH